MTTTEIREALHEVGDAVAAPAVDRLAFQARVRAERRRRTASRAVAGVAAAAVAGVVGTWAATGLVGGGPGADVTGAADAPVAGPVAPVPVALDGRLAVVAPDGAVARSEVRVEEVLGTTGSGVVVVDRDSHVRLVPVSGSGTGTAFGRARDLLGTPVQDVHVDRSGLVLGYVDLDGTLHLRELGSDDDFLTGPVPAGDRVMSVDGNRWTTVSAAEGLVLHEGETSTMVGLEFPADVAELDGQTLAVGTSDGVEVFEASDGTPRFGGSLGAEVSALGAGGTLVVTATGQEQSDRGMSVGVWVLDAFTGTQEPLHGYDGGPVRDLAWVDDDEVALLAGAGSDELWVCSTTAGRCEQRLTAAVGTLGLPRS